MNRTRAPPRGDINQVLSGRNIRHHITGKLVGRANKGKARMTKAKQSELEQLRERQAALQAEQAERAALADKIAALEAAELGAARLEAKAARAAEIRAAQAALDEAEAAALPVMLELDRALQVVKEKRAAHGKINSRIGPMLGQVTRETLERLQRWHPEFMGLAPRPSQKERAITAARAAIKRLQGLIAKQPGGLSLDDKEALGYWKALKQTQDRLAELEGRADEGPEFILTEADKRYLQLTGINPARARAKREREQEHGNQE